jgi:uncharacterized protein YeaO (DUF488 family)
MGEILIKRIYAPFEKSDGLRILVDRLWPRGIKKENAKIDAWLKEIAPSASLRKWFNHDPENWNEFVKRYKAELKQSQALHELNNFKREHKTITLLYAAHDTEHNNAVVLQRVLIS